MKDLLYGINFMMIKSWRYIGHACALSYALASTNGTRMALT